MSVLRSVVFPDPVPPAFNNIFSPAHALMRARRGQSVSVMPRGASSSSVC